MKATLLSPWVFIIFIITSCSKNSCTIKSDNLILEVNNQLEVRVNSAKCISKPLSKEFNASEYLITRGFEAKQFGFEKMKSRTVSDLHGKGTETIIRGVYKKDGYEIKKHLSITTYESFPGMAFFKVVYINSGQKNIDVIKWVNNKYSIESNGDHPAFWSFQGGSSNRRADWILPIDSAFSQENFMGMTNTDYGGGIPVTDIWRRDAGVAVGHVEPVPRFVSLPFYKDQYSVSASISVEYSYPDVQHFLCGDTLQTYETFVSVHTGDCYNTFTEYTRYMQSGGIKFIPDEPLAFEPVWCAWGYWQKFTMEQIKGTLQKVKDLGIKWVDIDDGYQITEGDWNIAPKRFPNGEKDMRGLVDKIHSMGMKAKIWWAPLAADPGSELITKNPDIIIRNRDGAPQYITGWECYYLSPTYKKTIDHTKSLLKMYLRDWDYDGLKMDGMHINSVGPDYNSDHGLENPDQSFEQLPLYFKTVYETAIQYKPHAVLQNCPCGCVVSYFNLPFMNQAVASDPASSWQIRLKGKIYKALRPGIAFYGDHIELSDGGMDFATQIGVGAVPGTKFTWPEGSFKLTPEKEAAMKKWITIYNREMISKETYLGSLYDIGYDKPETHVIQKGDTLYYAFYNKDWNGEIELRGLKEKKYTIIDYENEKVLGLVDGIKPVSNFSFKNHLLIKVFPSNK
jgi:alpha-galactosidase